MSVPFDARLLVVQSSICVLAIAGFAPQAWSEDTVEISRINFGSCIKQDQPLPILDLIVDQEPDLFIFLGDNIYADTEDMDLMRARYALLDADAGFTRLRKRTRVLATWDDHDFGANDGGADYAKRIESEQIFLDFWNIPSDSPARHRPGTYDALMFGPEDKRIQVILLDTRYFRGPLSKGDARVGGPYVPTADASITMLGEEQWKWLGEQLRAPAQIRIIASSIQFAAEDAGQETWSNLPHERSRMMDLIRETDANGVLFISGDRHWSELSVVDKDLPYPLFDLTSSSLNQPHPRGTPTLNRFRALPTTYHRENFGQLDIDWEDESILLKILDGDGNVQLRKRIRMSEISR